VIEAGCHLEWIETLKVQHWDGSQNLDVATTLHEEEDTRRVYRVGANEGPDEITLSVGAPGTVRLSIPHEEVYLATKREWPASTELIETELTGTFEASGRPPLDVEMTLYPDYGPPHALKGQATLDYLGGMAGELEVAFPRK
jgi:hypothetical protein